MGTFPTPVSPLYKHDTCRNQFTKVGMCCLQVIFKLEVSETVVEGREVLFRLLTYTPQYHFGHLGPQGPEGL